MPGSNAIDAIDEIAEAAEAGEAPRPTREWHEVMAQAGTRNTICRICEAWTQRCFTNRILSKYDVAYYFCDSCGFLQTERPYWLDEAYADAIAAEDVDLVARNLRMRRILTCVLPACFGRDAKLLDLAGGYGLLTRLMRNNGMAFSWSDKHCANLFAKEYEWNDAHGPVSAATAFEVLEHLEDPLAFIRDALDKTSTRTLIFTTQLFEGRPPHPGKWSYYAPEAGQHIAFYQPRTLAHIARLLGLNFYSQNGIHFLTALRLRASLLGILTGKFSHMVYFASRLALLLKFRIPALLRA
jgi:hypothetical protein